MNLPTIFNIAIGLIFIYLVLSLLASQIQEVIATILEWRAEQLTRAIENLVLGDTDPESQINNKKTYELVDNLFRNPLIRNLNQTSKSWGSRKIITQNKENRKTINPTYIHAETFSSTVLSELDIPKAARVLTWLNAKRLIHYEIYNKIDKLLESKEISQRDVIETHYEELKKCIKSVLSDYKMERYGLSSTLIRLRTQIETFKRETEEDFAIIESSQSQDNVFDQTIKPIKTPIDKITDFIFTPDKNDSDLVIRLRPSLTTILDLLTPPQEPANQAIDLIFTSKGNKHKLDICLSKLDICLNPSLTKVLEIVRISNTFKIKPNKGKTVHQLVSLFIRALDFGFLKPLHRATQFLRFGRALIIHDTNVNQVDQIINSIFQVSKNSYKLNTSHKKYFSKLLDYLISPHTSEKNKLRAYKSFKTKLKVVWKKNASINGINLKKIDDLYELFMAVEEHFMPLAYQSFQTDLREAETKKSEAEDKWEKSEIEAESWDSREAETEKSEIEANRKKSEKKFEMAVDLYESFTYAQDCFNKISYRLPESLRKSLYELALRSRIKALDIEQQLDQFKQEIETWFDRSMERASGVYKRNARGFAFLIGFVLAVTLNADTFYIISRLAKDDALRNSIVSTSTKLVESEQSSIPTPTASPSPTASSSSPASPSPTPTLSPDVIDRVKDKVDQSLSEITLPIGWTDNILEEQLQRDIPSKEGETAEQKQNREIQNEKRKIEQAPRRTKIFGRYVVPPEAIMIMGWLVTATAIMMGAPFWFDFLGLFINVRNTGSKPVSKASKK